MGRGKKNEENIEKNKGKKKKREKGRKGKGKGKKERGRERDGDRERKSHSLSLIGKKVRDWHNDFKSFCLFIMVRCSCSLADRRG